MPEACPGLRLIFLPLLQWIKVPYFCGSKIVKYSQLQCSFLKLLQTSLESMKDSRAPGEFLVGGDKLHRAVFLREISLPRSLQNPACSRHKNLRSTLNERLISLDGSLVASYHNHQINNYLISVLQVPAPLR
jgi:hypothetical protein